MELPQNQPIYWDKHRIPVNITLIFALGVAAFGLFLVFQGSNDWLLVLAGLGVAAFSWFTNPRFYYIYPDALIITYGRPRTKVVPFEDISRIEMRQMSAPDRLRVWQTSGKRTVLLTKDPDTFHQHLEQAVDEFRRAHPEHAPPDTQDEGEQGRDASQDQENRDNA